MSRDRNIQESAYLQNKSYVVAEHPNVQIKINRMAIKITKIVAAIMMK